MEKSSLSCKLYGYGLCEGCSRTPKIALFQVLSFSIFGTWNFLWLNPHLPMSWVCFFGLMFYFLLWRTCTCEGMLCATKSHIHPYLCWQCVGDCGVRITACTRARSAVCKQPHAGCIELLTETLEWFRYLLTLTTSALGQLLLALVHSQGGLCAKVMTAFLNEGKLMGYCMLRLCLHAVSTRCGDPGISWAVF